MKSDKNKATDTIKTKSMGRPNKEVDKDVTKDLKYVTNE